MGFIPALKIDKVDLGEGVTIRGEIVAGDEKSLQRFVKAFEPFLADWRDRASKEQTELDFTNAMIISAVKLRADKPKLKAKEYSIGIDMSNVSMDDRSKLHAMSQDKSKVIHISITSQPRRVLAPDKPKKSKDKSKANGMNGDPDSLDGELVDHSGGDLALPPFEYNSLEERLQLSLLLREGASDRWFLRIKDGLTDRNLKKAITSEWAGELYEATDDGKHFIVQGGNQPRFRLAPVAGVKVNITNKPDLQGRQLLAKAREVLGLEATAKKTAI